MTSRIFDKFVKSTDKYLSVRNRSFQALKEGAGSEGVVLGF